MARRRTGQRGQAQTEFAIILVGVAVISILVIVNFGGKIATLFGFAHDEIDTMGSAELDFGDPASSSGDSGSDSSDSSSASNDSSGGDSSSSSSSSSSSRGGGSSGGRSRASSSSKRDSDGFSRPDQVRKSGTYKLEGGDGSTTVHAGRTQGTKDQTDKGTAAGKRRSDARQSADRRRSEEARWQKRRGQAIDGERGARKKSDAPVLGFMRFALLAILLLGVLFLGRTLMASGGDSGGD
jgi:hypothetical protein